jgi:putative Mn2+ efflux pump MntP
MDWIEVLLTSVSMAVDATTVNAANGLEEPDMKVSKMAFIAGVLGSCSLLCHASAISSAISSRAS